jgi:hypothetical protein
MITGAWVAYGFRTLMLLKGLPYGPKGLLIEAPE